jgi:3-isopropylmalate dehydrogenase
MEPEKLAATAMHGATLCPARSRARVTRTLCSTGSLTESACLEAPLDVPRFCGVRHTRPEGPSLVSDTCDVKVVCLPGDGIGPEVTESAVRVLRVLLPGLELEARVFGGAAIGETGEPLPAETLAACRTAHAVLLGAVGSPEFDGAKVRPEQGLMRLRRELDVYANLRPARAPGIDVLVVRELLGGLYYGARGRREDGSAFDTCEYHPRQVQRIARRAFELARDRRGRLTSVDKANVLETSRLWREVVEEIAADYAGVELQHMLVDNAAMQLCRAPEEFDVVVTENTFGDILSDLAAGLTGGLGVAPSASLSDGGPGIFEPVHGSAPDIAGRGIANPAAMLRSVALMLRYALEQPGAARALEAAVEHAMVATPTPDLGGDATTDAFTGAVLEALQGVDVPAVSP